MVEQIRGQEKRLLESQAPKKEDLVVHKIRSYKTLEVENNRAKDVEYVVGAKDKGKQKEVGTKVNEPTKFIHVHDDISPFDIELERRRKETDALAKKLEIVENESTIDEMNNKIKLLENARKQSIAMPEDNVNDR